MAQVAADRPAGAVASSGGLEEIVVTATRRETRLQDTPIAVSAIDQSLIEQASPRDIGDLAAFVPNFSAATIANFNAASFAMRGVGQTNIIVYFEPPVAVLVDDFVVPSVQTQLLDTFDIAQVEVLRGPQGTLFGKNTTGGAVTVRTKRPEMNVVGVEGRAQYGSFGTRRVQGAANVPILEDVLALRLVAGHEKSQGYYRNGACYGPVAGFSPSKFDGVSGCLDNSRLGGKDVWSARAKLLFQPNSKISALLQYEWLRDRSDAVPSVNENGLFEGPGGADAFLTTLLGTIRQNPNSADPLKNAASTNRFAGLISMPLGQRVSVDGVYLNVDIDVGVGTLTSVSGYRFQRSRLPNSYAGAVAIAPDGEPLSFFDANRDDDRKTYQQEVRFASDFGGPFDMVAGGFYQKDKTEFCVAQLLGFQDLLGPPTPYGPWNQTPFTLCNAQKAESKALFAEGTFKFTPELTLTAGARYSWDDKTWWGRQQTFIANLGTPVRPVTINEPLDLSVFNFPDNVVSVDMHNRKLTYRGSLGWQATPSVFFYGTVSRGYKGGGFNDQIGGFAAFGADLDAFREAAKATNPEIADSYEAGVKSEFFDRRLRFNLTGFHVKYKDLQKQLNVPIVVNGLPNQVTMFVNAASATVNGIELETSATPVDGLTLRGVLGYQDAKYNRYTAPNAGYDLATAPLDRAPKWQWTLDATYEVPIGDEFKLIANGNAAYTGRNLSTQAIDTPFGNTYLNARTLLNASLTLAQVDDKYFVRVIGRNLTDKRYRIASQNVAGLWLNTQFGPPRFYGVEVGMKFGQ
ncbi:TonB-dependent receptor [Sphingomonas flavalba]|uniref:TonB-dependent receptor n=1 Tax=Sphingomonas flavalba TaxID=2559804 RepID=UPI001EF02B86|nr:TonB-dependent receptor [Sphingomonas flavalba]